MGVSLILISFLEAGTVSPVPLPPHRHFQGAPNPNVPTKFILHSSARTKTWSEVGVVIAAT